MSKTTKKVKYPIHKQGKFCGYEEYEDGSIRIAPSHSGKMDAILIEMTAIDQLLKSMTEQCHKVLISLTERKAAFWESVSEDYSLDIDKYNYFYSTIEKKIRREEIEKEPQPCQKVEE